MERKRGYSNRVHGKQAQRCSRFCTCLGLRHRTPSSTNSPACHQPTNLARCSRRRDAQAASRSMSLAKSTQEVSVNATSHSGSSIPVAMYPRKASIGWIAWMGWWPSWICWYLLWPVWIWIVYRISIVWWILHYAPNLLFGALVCDAIDCRFHFVSSPCFLNFPHPLASGQCPSSSHFGLNTLRS